MCTMKKVLVTVCVAMAAIVLSAAIASAEEAKPAPAPEPGIVKVVGTVSVARDADNVITGVTLTTQDNVAYSVRLNQKGVELGEQMDGKQAEVNGVVKEKDGRKMINVISFKPVEAPQEPAK